MTRTCQRCGAQFQRGRRNPDVWCSTCDDATKDNELVALIFDDRSGIRSLHETFQDAAQTMKNDAVQFGICCAFTARVKGQSGARAELRLQDPTSAWWDEQDARLDRAEFEEQTR